MNIKNDEAQKLAHELSKLTGESLTAAVTKAVRERLERVKNAQGAGLADRLLHIGKDCAAHPQKPFRSANHGTILYDDRGLPPRR
jgi:antitoxin VapB